MSTCCNTPSVPPRADGVKGTLIVALAGNPNSGKTTLFNALTGLRQKVANYPGVTVEKKTGRCKLSDGRRANVIDLPGTYSLISRSPDEQVAMEVLRGLRPDTPVPDVVIVVVDASNLQRNLYLVSQLIELGRPMVVALNMMDVAERRGLAVRPEQLERELGVPVVPVVGHKRRGVADLKAAVARAKVAPMPDWPLPEPMKRELLTVGAGLAKADAATAHPPASPGLDLDRDVAPAAWICRPDGDRRLDRYEALAERLLIGDRAADVGHLADREPVASLLRASAGRLAALGIDPMQADVEAHYHWIESVAARASAPPGAASPAPGPTWSQRLDAVFVHKFWGLVIFAAVMGALFVALFWLAAPVMDAINGGVKWLGELAAAKLPQGPLRALVTDGIFAGVGAVIVFVPQIALLFLFLAILEDSGYLARAAFLMDRLLAKVGLHGKSFIPLLSSFACAIPGIMATRTIEGRKDRLATILVAPFMSCSARLPVYVLLIGFVGTMAGIGAVGQAGIMLALYALGIAAAAAAAWVFKRSLLKGAPTAFILEMPGYKLPQASQVARQVWTNTKAFVVKAGTIIFFLSVILWALTYYGASPARLEQLAAEGADENAIAAERINHSVAGRFGHAIEPAIRPLGYDWKMGVGLVGAFAAREVFVSTMGIVYSVGDPGDETADLAKAMRADVHAAGPRAGQPVWTVPVALSLLVWFVLAMQCMSTLAIARRETGGWRWPVFMLAYMNALAYLLAFGVYQLGRLVG